MVTIPATSLITGVKNPLGLTLVAVGFSILPIFSARQPDRAIRRECALWPSPLVS